MNNKEKAKRLAEVIYRGIPVPVFVLEALEAELNRLDAPEMKKWGPRGGEYFISHTNRVTIGSTTKDWRLSGRKYPTREEAERAAPLHHKMDRLVNWLVEHHDDFDGELSFGMSPTGSLRINFENISGRPLLDAILSGEVEL